MKYVLRLLGISFLMVMTISLGTFLEARHAQVFDINYESCKRQLIKDNNFLSVSQAAQCAQKQSVELRVLGTILFRDGSYLE